jgi:serine protease AprX
MPANIARGDRRCVVRWTAAATGLAALLAAGGLAEGAVPAYAGRATTVDDGGQAPTGAVNVVVRADSAATATAVKALVKRDGGTVKRDLGLINGFAATVPPATVIALRALKEVRVTIDATVTMKGDYWGSQGSTTQLNSVVGAAGAKKADWDNPDDGQQPTGMALTGAGVGVALIDSGVAPVQGLNGAGKIIYGPDLSFESQVPTLRNIDTYGHGTHMAGIIAGQDPSVVNGARFDGMAPGAKIISLKVASAEGASDVSQVIAAIDWVVAHRNDPGLNIRVLSLSFGTTSLQSATLDPLSFAVQQAWNRGIVVVVAAGNDGFAADTLTMPAANPDVIAVGAVDTRGTDARTDDVVADFSSRGNALRHPDLLAAGRSIVSLRIPGSYLDRTYPTALLSTTADPAQRFFRGSGTSQAAAMMSGAAALLIQQRPTLTPDKVKRLLMNTATPIVGGDAYAAGNGQINVATAAATATPSYAYQQNADPTGLGSLELSRGDSHVYDSANGAVLTGEQDIFGKAWNASVWAQADAAQRTWVGGTWNGSAWTGTSFGASSYNNQTWASVTWTGTSWSGLSWLGRSWTSAVWTGRSWTAETWLGRSWTGRSWTSADWTAAPWA